jgi:hypothetical protein
VRSRTPGRRRPRQRRFKWPTAACALAFGLPATAFSTPADAAAVRPPLESAVSTSNGSWVILPMGDLSNRDSTFWQLFRATPGSSHWSLVTPPGVADNGGLVAGASAGSILVGVLPSKLLRFSPLSQSRDGGTSWGPAYFPAGLAVLPDALAFQASAPGGAIAVVGGGARALVASTGFASWSPLVSTTDLRRVSPGCGVTTLDALAILPTGSPLVAAGCRGGGRVGVFTRTVGLWQPTGFTLSGSQSGSATEVLRLAVTGSTTTMLVSASRTGHHALVALWRTGGAPWTASAPLPVSSASSVLSTAVSTSGALALLMGTTGGRRDVVDIAAGGPWTQLPGPPAKTEALAMPAGPESLETVPVDAFTVDGGTLGVFALTPSGTRWVRAQSSQIPLAYGSSG